MTVLDDRATDFMSYAYDDLIMKRSLQGVTGYVQPMGGAEFIVEEGNNGEYIVVSAYICSN